jgi:hypothetical protein
VLTRDAIELRLGFRWSATIPLEDVIAVEPLSSTEAEKLARSRDYLRLSIFDEPSHLIRLGRPVRVEAIAGFGRTVTCIGLAPDDDDLVPAIRRMVEESRQSG